MSTPAPHAEASGGHGHAKSFWLWVMCLTGVDYFSTLGYQPSIAYSAAGILSPLATIVLVLVTLFCALPVYRYVCAKSPHGQGSIGMLQQLVGGWAGKLLILVLVGFAATDYVITKTLSAADAAAHLVENPLFKKAPGWLHSQMGVTMFLLVLLGGMFLRGFKEVIGIAVTLVAVYLALNAALIAGAGMYLFQHPELLAKWWADVLAGQWHVPDAPFAGRGGWWPMLAASVLIFPKLALGLSGFETGVSVMPLVKGDADDTEACPKGRIRNTRKLLMWAALIMSVFLICSSILTATLIKPSAMHKVETPPATAKLEIAGKGVELSANGAPLALGKENAATMPLEAGAQVVTLHVTPEALRDGFKLSGKAAPVDQHGNPDPRAGKAFERALAYLAHGEADADLGGPICPWFGRTFGTIYDISTILILWFAGASAMAGLLNLVPKYLPQYGMAPEWAAAVRPLTIFFTVVNLIVTLVFRASVEAQSGAYATGVLVLISSACIATVIDLYRQGTGRWAKRMPWAYVLITLAFFYTTASVIVEKPEGIKIAGCFIATVLGVSALSRARRSSELRVAGFDFRNEQSKFLWDSLRDAGFPVLVPHRPGGRSLAEKEATIRKDHHLPPETQVVFVEAEVGDASDFYNRPEIEVHDEGGRILLQARRCASIPHTLAALALEMSKTGSPPEIHFGWSNESPLAVSASFLFFGEGNVPWIVRELIAKAEADPAKQPRVVIG